MGMQEGVGVGVRVVQLRAAHSHSHRGTAICAGVVHKCVRDSLRFVQASANLNECMLTLRSSCSSMSADELAVSSDGAGVDAAPMPLPLPEMLTPEVVVPEGPCICPLEPPFLETPMLLLPPPLAPASPAPALAAAGVADLWVLVVLLWWDRALLEVRGWEGGSAMPNVQGSPLSTPVPGEHKFVHKPAFQSTNSTFQTTCCDSARPCASRVPGLPASLVQACAQFCLLHLELVHTLSPFGHKHTIAAFGVCANQSPSRHTHTCHIWSLCTPHHLMVKQSFLPH
eukprot:1138629-Pelagomonas_calceolata.AAC.7